MYNSQEVAKRIKETSKNKGVSLKEMLAMCDLSINTVSQVSAGRDISAKNLSKIADYLDCSVDYLLGRNEKITVNNELQITNDVEESADNWRKLFSEFTMDELMKIMLILNETVQKKINCN